MTRSSWARSKLIRRNRRQNGPFTHGEVIREVQQPGDPIPKQEVDMDRSRKRAVFLPDDIERQIDGKSSADEGGPAMEPLLLTKLLGLGRSKVFAMLAVGELAVIRIGRSVRVPRAALEGWVAEQTQHASAGAGMPVLSSWAWRIEMASPVPARARSREVFPESRCWALDGRRLKRRLECRPEKRRPF